MGATGVGKSHLAKQIFQLKKDKFQLSGRFIDVNCATLRGDSAMSTLFGHIKVHLRSRCLSCWFIKKC